MTKYKRFTGKVFGGNATATGNDPQIAQFGSALEGTYIGTTDPEEIQGLSNWGQGWIGAVTPETQFPPLPEMTGAMKVLSHQICGILQQGVSNWDSGTIYYTGNFCSKNGIVYVSLTDENQGNDPETDTTNWRNYGGANLDLSNLSAVGEKHFLNKSQITNCLLEVPQNIKLELTTEGKLTTKAGTKVIIPNGPSVFNEVTISKDITTTSSSFSNRQAIVWYNGSSFMFDYVTSVSSGASFPTTGIGTGHKCYNTTENKIYRYDGTNWNAINYSLPICIVTFGATAGVITSIDQVFNGFGYIGSTVWVDKGVKYLACNGRNADGSLNNIEYVTTSVKIRTNPLGANLSYFRLLKTGNLIDMGPNTYFEQEEQPTAKYALWYKPSENIMYYCGSDGVWTDDPWDSIYAITATADSTGKITSFNPKLTFRAVDWNDFNNLTANVNNRYVVEKSDKSILPSWYTVYSDGWIEQGGVTTSVPTNGTGTITFLKPFSNTNYTVTQGIRPADNEISLGRIAHFQRTKYTDKILYANDGWSTINVGVYMDWYACGY